MTQTVIKSIHIPDACNVHINTGDVKQTSHFEKQAKNLPHSAGPQEIGLLELLGISKGTPAQVEMEADHERIRKTMQSLEKPSSENTLYWKTSLEWMISYNETIEAIHSNGDLYQAYGVHKKVHQFDPDERDIKFLMEYCLSLMLTKRDQQASKEFDKIVSLVRNMGETYPSVLRLAKKTVKIEDKTFETILLCLIAAKLSDMSIFTVHDVNSKLKCMTVLREAAGKVSEGKEEVKPFLRRFCIKGVWPLFEHIQQTAPSAEMNKSLIRLRIATFHCMEILLLYADDDEGRAQLLENALQFLRETYGDEVFQRKWYGIFSNNLGATYLQLSRPDKAAEALRWALQVFEQANDLDDENERLEHIKTGVQMLKQPSLAGLGADQ